MQATDQASARSRNRLKRLVGLSLASMPAGLLGGLFASVTVTSVDFLQRDQTSAVRLTKGDLTNVTILTEDDPVAPFDAEQPFESKAEVGAAPQPEDA